MAHSTTHAANRITYRGSADCEQTRARFGERVPLIDQPVAPELAVAGAAWSGDRGGSDGPPRAHRTCLPGPSRPGRLLSLSGQYLQEARERPAVGPSGAP